MEPLLLLVYIHVIASLVLVAALGAEALALSQPRHFGAMPGIRPAGSICLVILFFSGGFLTDHAHLWKMAWPKIAVAIIVAFGALSGLSSRRLAKIRHADARAELRNEVSIRQLHDPFLKSSLSIRVGLVLAAVWLMVVKPDLIHSLGAVAGFIVVCWGLAAAIKPAAPAHPAAATNPNFDGSGR
jgi:hypothetical protein